MNKKHLIYSIILSGLMLFSSIGYAGNDSTGYGTFSQGFRMGQLSKYSVKGMLGL